MNKNFLYRLYSGAFICACLIPAAFMPFVKGDSSKEKRELSAPPSIKNSDGSFNMNVLSDLGSYFGEHFAFRQQLVTADSRIKVTAAGTSPNTDVIAGKDGWLYYDETADDFLNINTMNSRQIAGICHDLRLLDEYCTQCGADFIFVPVPNKNSLYPEHMPFNYVPADAPDNYELLTQELSGNSFYLDMRAELSSAQADVPLYHKTDTHWNDLGAYFGHCAIMNKLGMEACPADGWHTVPNGRLGDLAAMIYPAEDAKDTQITSNMTFSYEYTSRFRGLDDITITTASTNGTGSLLMYRDSFGEAILPYMAQQFETAQFSRIFPYRTDEINVSGADTVVLEIVERNLPKLAKNAPVMPAPTAEKPNASIYAGDFSDDENQPVINWELFDIRAEKSGSYLCITGALPDIFFSGSSHSIFLTVGDDTYEAFCASELSDSGCGFTAYLPADCLGDSLTVTSLNVDGNALTVNIPESAILRSEQ